MTKSEEKAFEELLAYIKQNYCPIGDNLYNCELDEEFNTLVFRVNPKSRFLYELDPFAGVFI